MNQFSTVCGASTIKNNCFSDGNDSHLYKIALSYKEDQNTKNFALKAGDSANDNTNENGNNAKIKYL